MGKTYRMLDEARRRAGRGTDVVVGYAECHGRQRTEEMLGGLEVLPRAERDYRGRTYPALDIDGVLRRRPQVVVVDELAHSNVPGCRNAKRWQDVEELLAAGIDVIAAINIQHLESLNDVVEKITRVPQHETVPDDVVRRADQIELVDMPPEALRRRMAHGNIYAPDKIDASLANYFQTGNLTALRELALLWVADRVDEALRNYRSEHGIGGVWETRERVVVALTGGPEGETLIRRAARIAARSAHGELLAVHIVRSDGLAGGTSHSALARQRHLVETLGGSYHSVVGDDVPTALVLFARAENATQLVLGTSRRGRLERFLTGLGIGETTVALSSDIDVHMVTHERAGHGRTLPSRRRTLPTSRLVAGPVAGLLLPVLLTFLLDRARGTFNLTSEALLFLVTVMGVACIGGVVSALVAALTASLLLNYWFIPPIGELTFNDPDNMLALGVFAVVAGTVAATVDRSLKLSRRAARATAEAETLSSLAGSIVRGDDAIPALLTRTQETFGMDSAELVEEQVDDPAATQVSVGPGALPPAARPHAARIRAQSPRRLRRPCRRGRGTGPARRGRRRDRTGQGGRPDADRAARGGQPRSADPAGRRMGGRRLTAQPGCGLHGRGTGRTARHCRRVHGPAQPAHRQSAGHEPAPGRRAHAEPERHPLEAVVPSALDSLPPDTPLPVILGLEETPPVLADPPLLERVIANLVSNAARYAPPEHPVLVTASALAGRVEVRVVDRGPGLPPTDRERIFEPFQRLGDNDNTTGVGLGLALARGLTEAMGGTLTPEDTPGGGLTMVVSMPFAGAVTGRTGTDAHREL